MKEKMNIIKKISLFLIAGILLTTFVPVTVIADGGPMVDPYLFAKLKEGQQVAVVTLQDTDTASVDLFVSILDETRASHEVTFFVPLGEEPGGFGVVEEDSLEFNKTNTMNLDSIIFGDYRNDKEFIQWLFQNDVSFIIVLTKSDKLSKNQLSHNLRSLELALAEFTPSSVIIPASSSHRTGKEEILGIIDQHLSI